MRDSLQSFLTDILMIEMKARVVRSAAKAESLPVSLFEQGFIRGVFKSHLTSNKPRTCYNGTSRYIVFIFIQKRVIQELWFGLTFVKGTLHVIRSH